MNWRLFVGASILVVALMFKVGAPLVAIVGGVALAALLSWLPISSPAVSSPSTGG
jgi:hypothetical protein